MNFNFNNITVQEKVIVRGTGRVAIPRNPDGMRIRLFKDGSVYPSKELTAKYDLEYVNKDWDNQGNGIDVVDSRVWSQYPEGADNYIFVTFTPKDQSKVDLFAHTKYDDSLNPISSVLDQGSKRPELVDMIREVYNLHSEVTSYEDGKENGVVDTLFGELNYVDLDIHVDVELPVSTKIFYLPKKVMKGVKRGQDDYVRRENSVFHPLTVAVSVEVEQEEVSENNIVE
jgi:hypothetical protein